MIWAFPAAATQRQEPIEMVASGMSISSFGLDEDGELYVTDLGGGRVLRLTDRS